MSRWNESIMAVNVLQLTEDDAVRQERRAQRALSLVSVGSFVAVLALLGMECYRLWFAWQSGSHQSWSDFWDSTRNLWATVPLWLGWSGLRGEFDKVFAKARVLRRAFADYDERLAPLAPEHLVPLAAADVPIGTVRIGPLAASAYRNAQAQRVVLIAVGCAGAVLAVVSVGLFIVGTRGTGNDPTTLPVAIVLGAMAVLSLGILGFLVGLVRRQRRGVWLAADDWGVRRLCARRRERIEMPWHEARAFFRLDAPPDERHALRAVYGLYGSDRLLAWAVPTRAGADQLAANERLCRLIATRTSLPLRAFSTESGLLANDDSAAKAEPTALQPAPTTPSAPSQRQGWNPGCVLVLFCLLVPLVGLIAQFTQGR